MQISPVLLKSKYNSFRSGSSVTNIYRVGHRGKVDLECIPGGAAVHGHYFPDHLPVLGRPSSVSVSIPPPKCSTASPAKTAEVIWAVGDRVEVSIAFEALRQLQENHGGFNVRMSEIIGKTGESS